MVLDFSNAYVMRYCWVCNWTLLSTPFDICYILKKSTLHFILLFIYSYLQVINMGEWWQRNKVLILCIAYARQLSWQTLSFILLQAHIVLLHPALLFKKNILHILIIICRLTTLKEGMEWSPICYIVYFGVQYTIQ